MACLHLFYIGGVLCIQEKSVDTTHIFTSKEAQVHQPIRKLLCIQIVMVFLMFLFFSNINKALALEYTGFVQIDDEIKSLTIADKLQLIGAISTKNLYIIDSGTLSILKKVGFQNTLKNLAIDDDSKTLYVIHKESLTGTIYSIDLNSMAMSTCLERMLANNFIVILR